VELVLDCRRVWDALTGDELCSFEHKHIVRTCAFSEVRINFLRFFHLDYFNYLVSSLSDFFLMIIHEKYNGLRIEVLSSVYHTLSSACYICHI